MRGCALRLSFSDDYHEASVSDKCQLQTLGPHGCSTCHYPIGHSSSVTKEKSSSLRKLIACVAGGGFLFAFDFLTSLQSQGPPPAYSSFMCPMKAGTPDPKPRFDLTHVLSWQSVSPAFPLLSKKLIISQWAAHPLSCPVQLSLEYRWLYVLEPTCRHYPRFRPQPLLFLSSRCVLSLQNISSVLPLSQSFLLSCHIPSCFCQQQGARHLWL